MSALLSSLSRSPSSLQFTANPVNCWQHCHDKRKTLSPSLYPSLFAEFIRLYYYQCICPIGFSDHMYILYCSNSLPVLLNHPWKFILKLKRTKCWGGSQHQSDTEHHDDDHSWEVGMYAVYRPGGEDTPCTPCRTVKCAKVHCQAFQCTALPDSRVSVNLKYLQNQYIPSTVLYLCLYHTCTVFVWYVLGVQCGCHKNMPSNHGPSRPCRVTTVGAGLDKVVMCAMWK